MRERLSPFVEAGATRFIIPYVPTTDNVVEDAMQFVRAWGGDRVGRTVSVSTGAG